MRTKLLLPVLLAFASGFAFTSCDDDGDSVRESALSWRIVLPEKAGEATVDEMHVTLTNINTATEYRGTLGTSDPTVSVRPEEGAVTVHAVLPEGFYRVSAEGKISYKNETGTPVTANVRAYVESVTVSGSTFILPESKADFYSPSEGFVIEEIYFAGSTTPENKQYSADQYFKIYNNSSKVMYADGLAILGSAFLTVNKYDYTPNLMDESFSADFIFVIPGNGTEHPVQPGASLVIALDASNHLEANPNSIDLSRADFEFYDESPNEKFQDTQNPSVPDLDKWYSSTMSYTALHNRGFQSYCLAKMEVDKETFLKQHGYTAAYTFRSPNGQEFPMSTDCYFIPNAWIVDAVNLSIASMFEWIVTSPSLDSGWTFCGQVDRDNNRYNKSVIRKTASVENGRRILKDTNNSTEDFEPEATPSLKKQ